MTRRSALAWSLRVIAITSVLTALMAAVVRLDPLEQGLHANYFTTIDWTSRSVLSTVDRLPSTRIMAERWLGPAPGRFSVRWRGCILVPADGQYRFATVSDDGSHVYVDDQLVVDNGGGHGALLRDGTITLSRGVHPFVVDYFQQGGDARLDLLWARGGASLERLPSWVLGTRQVSAPRFLTSVIGWRTLAGLEWIWVASLLVPCALGIRKGMVWIRRMLERDGTWPTMRWILAGSMCLSVAGIWWGLPADWVAIELTPSMVLKALSQHFSHGWADPYPPLHFYVLSVAISPMLLLEVLNRVDLMDPASYAAMALMSRFISVVLALGIVLATCRCGVRLFGARAGVWAAGIFTLVAPFLYYSKTANVDVPYLFWASLSLLCYLRILESHQHAQRPRTWDYVGFAATATLSVCTKDQAYGLFALAPLVIVYEHWRANRRDRTSHPIVGAIVNGPMIAAALTAVVLFALIHNLLFNSSGFVEHVRFITGPGSVLYRAFPRTLGGHVQLLGRTIFLIQVSFGWPFFLLAIAGLLIGLFTRRLRRASLWLLVPAVSYYAAFINVILYDYDRFVLPICLVLAVFGGLAIDRALAWSATRRRWVAAAVGAAFAYTVLYASAVDVLMMGDSRYASQRWLAARVRPGDLIGHVFDPEQLPRLDGYRHTDVTTIAELQTDTPAFYVLNADYARAVPPNEPETPTRRLVEGLQGETLGYHLVYRFRRPAPWPWLPAGHPDLFGPREEFEVLSTLHNINPMIEIFQRDVPAVQ